MVNVYCFVFIFISFFASSVAATSLDWNDPKWQWMDEQIEQDFRNFQESGITTKMLDEVMSNASCISFGDHLKRFRIINGRVYGPQGDYNPKGLLEKVAALYPVPNVDIILFTQDIIWNPWDLAGPVLSTCSFGSPKIIHCPIQLWEEWENKYAPVVDQISQKIVWEDKMQKMFWRGTSYGPDHLKDPSTWTQFERGRLCTWSKQMPELLDACFTDAKFWMFHSDQQKNAFIQLFPLSPASWEEYLSHQYLIDLDGYVASTPGCAWKLLSNCAVFKRNSRFTLWYYRNLLPWVHYIPLADDLSDLFEKIGWAKEHPAETKKIAENGRIFAKENIMPEHLYLYCYKLLMKYASLQKSN